MGALYSGTTVSGYNANPPPDDGTTGANNQITWNGTIKSKIGDPLNVAVAAMSAALVTAMGKTLSGGSVVSTAVSYPASAADQGRNIVATVSGITVTTPDATSVLSPFVFAVNNQSSGNITIAGFGGTQNVDGATTVKVGKGRGVILWTDSVNWFSSGLVMGNLPLANPPFGFDMPINLQLNATTGSSALTIAVKANDGTDPTTSNPVLIPFRDQTGASGNTTPGPHGGPVWIPVTAALSVVLPASQAMGTSNNVPFRFWIVALNNSGTAELALINCVVGAASPTQIFPLAEHNLISTTAIGSAPSAGVFYSTGIRTSVPFRILGYVEFSAGMATAGTYTGSPTNLQLFGPGIKKPGDVVQVVYSFTTTQTAVTGTTKTQTAQAGSITPTSTANLVQIQVQGNLSAGGSSVALAQISRGASPTLIGNPVGAANGAGTSILAPANLTALDAPGSVSATAYFVYVFNNTAGQTATWNQTVTGAVGSTQICTEIMG